MNKWHLWFAWYPIEIKGRIFWLENIYRISNDGNGWRYLSQKDFEVDLVKERISGFKSGTFSYEESSLTSFLKVLLFAGTFAVSWISFLLWAYS